LPEEKKRKTILEKERNGASPLAKQKREHTRKVCLRAGSFKKQRKVFHDRSPWIRGEKIEGGKR